MAHDQKPNQYNPLAQLAQSNDAVSLASTKDVKALIDQLASTHDLTMAEASEMIEEWQVGLGAPLKRPAA